MNESDDVLAGVLWTVLDALAVLLVAGSVGAALFVYIGWWALGLSGLIIFLWARAAVLVPELLAAHRERAAARRALERR